MSPPVSALLIVVGVVILLEIAHIVYHWFRNRRKSREFYAKLSGLKLHDLRPYGQYPKENKE